eukprot:jgi/Ulvmu1/2769/UM014_0227.1
MVNWGEQVAVRFTACLEFQHAVLWGLPGNQWTLDPAVGKQGSSDLPLICRMKHACDIHLHVHAYRSHAAAASLTPSRLKSLRTIDSTAHPDTSATSKSNCMQQKSAMSNFPLRLSFPLPLSCPHMCPIASGHPTS